MTRAFPKNIRQIKYDAFTQMTRSIQKWALFADKLSFQYDGTNRRVYKKRAYYVNPQRETSNEEVQEQYEKIPSRDEEILERYEPYSGRAIDKPRVADAVVPQHSE